MPVYRAAKVLVNYLVEAFVNFISFPGKIHIAFAFHLHPVHVVAVKDYGIVGAWGICQSLLGYGIYIQ